MSGCGRFLPVGIPLANQSRTQVGRSKLTGCGCNDPNLKHTLNGRLLDPVARHPPSRPGLGRLGWPPEVWPKCVARGQSCDWSGNALPRPIRQYSNVLLKL
jgi:hypothetical protein